MFISQELVDNIYLHVLLGHWRGTPTNYDSSLSPGDKFSIIAHESLYIFGKLLSDTDVCQFSDVIIACHPEVDPNILPSHFLRSHE